jgi:hypothetical protein
MTKKRTGLGPMAEVGQQQLHVLQKTTPDPEHKTSATPEETHDSYSSDANPSRGRRRSKNEETLRQTTLLLPESLYKKLRHFAVDKDSTIRNIIEDALELYLPLIDNEQLMQICTEENINLKQLIAKMMVVFTTTHK